MPAPFTGDPGLAAFGSSLTAITLAELGDKTFFMALILAVRHRARWVFIGAFAALTAVTVLSLGLGYGLRELLPQTVVPWLAAVLFLGFGLKLLLDAQGMAADAAGEEAEEAEEAINAAETRKPLTTPWAVIWEAFKAETEPKRSIRQEELAARDDKPKKAAEAQSGGTAGAANAPSASVGTKRDQEFIQQEGGIY